MPELSRPDGARIHFEMGGNEGPAVVMATYWSWIPGVYQPVLDDLAADHRVVTYHLRGTGESSRDGPFDMQTDLEDLEAVVEEAGGPTILVGTADSSNRAVKLAARRPELIAGVITFGAAPFARSQFEGKEGLVGSETVLGAFTEMLERNYRGAMRTFMQATNPQMSEEELRDRVAAQSAFCTPQAALQRLRAWLDDDPRAEAQAIGERLWVFAATDVAGPWLPPAPEVESLMRETLPEAVVVEVEPGPVSAPEVTAAKVREAAASLLAGATKERK